MNAEAREAAAITFRNWLDLNHDATFAAFTFTIDTTKSDPEISTSERAPFRPPIVEVIE